MLGDENRIALGSYYKGSRPKGLNKTDVTLPMTTQSLTLLRAEFNIKSDVYIYVLDLFI